MLLINVSFPKIFKVRRKNILMPGYVLLLSYFLPFTTSNKTWLLDLYNFEKSEEKIKYLGIDRKFQD